MKAPPAPALTKPPKPGRLQQQQEPHSEELQFLLLPAEATAHLQTHGAQGAAGGEERWLSIPWGAERSCEWRGSCCFTLLATVYW